MKEDNLVEAQALKAFLWKNAPFSALKYVTMLWTSKMLLHYTMFCILVLFGQKLHNSEYDKDQIYWFLKQ